MGGGDELCLWYETDSKSNYLGDLGYFDTIEPSPVTLMYVLSKEYRHLVRIVLLNCVHAPLRNLSPARYQYCFVAL